MAVLLLTIFAGITTSCAASYPSVMPTRIITVGEEQMMHTFAGAPEHWNDFPIQVSADPNMPREYLEETEQAVRVWNSLVGYEFLLFDARLLPLKPATHGRIIVTMISLGISVQTNTRLLGEAVVTCDAATGSIKHAAVHLDTDLPSEQLQIVIIHELSHAIGLAHDEHNRGSTMFPVVWEPRAQRIEERDIEAIRHQLFGPLRAAPSVYIEPVSIKWAWFLAEDI